MNKAKAIFAAGIIVVVASASVAMWHLNERGLIGNNGTTTYVDEHENENVEKDNAQKNENQQKNDDTQKNEYRQDNDNTETEPETDKNVDNITDVQESEINDFLTVFSKVYFAEHGKAFDIKKCSDYDFILFAFSHIRRTDKSLITIEQRDDSIMYYNGVPFEKVNEVLEKYFDVSVGAESVYTENSYAFFSYSDGYFYTPATDGLSYKNTAVVNSVENEDDYIIAKFSVFSGEKHYADAEAKIQMKNGEMKLTYYAIYK